MQPERYLAIHRARVNVKSLAEEARIIRHELERIKRLERTRPANNEHQVVRREARRVLITHRRGRLRAEARIAQLALAFLRGRRYKEVEATTNQLVSNHSLQSKLTRFGEAVSEQTLREWLRS